MQFLTIAGYLFVSLDNLKNLQQRLRTQCETHQLKGTILLSHEGINLNLTGIPKNIDHFLTLLKEDVRFLAIKFHEAYTEKMPFKRLKIKLKPEIISLKQSQATPTAEVQAPRIAPQQLKEWLDHQRKILLIDTRNEYEFHMGSFVGAKHLHLKHFSEFPHKLDELDKSQEMVLYCTGGIRCEKAAIHMMNEGFSHVYQLDGGILGYFAQVGGDHYQGECFVFDERISVNASKGKGTS